MFSKLILFICQPDFSTPATTSDTDITSRFDLDTGQRDNYYDIGRLKLKTGALNTNRKITY
jgi:hypothetical protein